MDGLGVGRMVHFVAFGGVHKAAIVVRVHEDSATGRANLKVFHDGPGSSDTWETSVDYDPSPTPEAHTWHWPEKV